MKLEGLTSRFRFVGYEECLPAAYCAMDLLVVPSLIREGFGMTALEGYAFGKPVVAYDSGGLREILNAAGCGELLVPAADIGALAERVNTLLAAPAMAAAIGSLARERIEAVYGPAAYRARLYGLAERWYLRYCLAPPQVSGAGPARSSAGGREDAPRQRRRGYALAPRRTAAGREAPARQAAPRQSPGARGGTRPRRKKRAAGSARRKASGGGKHRRAGHARRRGRRRRKAG